MVKRVLKRRHSKNPLPMGMERECPVCGWEDQDCNIGDDAPYCMGCGQLLRESTEDERTAQNYRWYKVNYGWNKRQTDKHFAEQEEKRKIEQEEWIRRQEESGLEQGVFFQREMEHMIDDIFGKSLERKIVESKALLENDNGRSKEDT